MNILEMAMAAKMAGGNGGTGPIDPKRLPEGYPYKETTIVTEFLPETEVDFFEIEGMFPSDPDLNLQVPDFGLEKEKQYRLRVMWDGVPYDRTVLMAQNYAYVIGNMALAGAGDDTGEPFLIMFGSVTGGDATYEVDFSFMANSAGEHTVSIAEVSETIHTMAPEFLPAGVGGGAYMMELKPNDYSVSSGGMTVPSVSYDPILDALDKGQMVFIKVWQNEDAPMPIPMIVFYVALDDNGYLVVNDAGGGVLPITFQTGKHTV